MRKLKPYILLLIIISLVSTSLLACNKVTRVTLEQVLDKVNAATTEIESFHMTMTMTNPGDLIDTFEGDFMLPDKSRYVTYEQGIKKAEMRRIGANIYQWDSESGLWELMEGNLAEATLASMQAMAEQLEPEYIADNLEMLEYIEALPDKIIHGVSCEHYRGDFDFYNLDYYREQIENETDPDRKEDLQHILEMQEQLKEEQEGTAVAEYWFGKDDYILRQIRSTMSMKTTEDEDFNGTIVPTGTRVTMTATLTFSNFNEPVEIEAPLLE